ncbi:MAG: phosphodiester glycosidase family protein [Bacteroidales bacterium]|nr:phosphodiester glycosidase family protein [Candidatus Colimorpha pelethequi]
MKRFLILLLLCATLIGIGATRHPKRKAVVKSDPRIDSITFARAEWQNDTLDGFILHRHQFKFQPLFASPQNICYIELPPNSPRKIFFAADTILTTVSQQAQHHDALAAVNGSYFDMDLGNPVCYLRIKGTALGENTPSATDSIHRKYYQYATIVLQKGRPVLIVPDSNRLWEDSLKHANIMTAGPMLLYKGTTVPQRKDRTFVTNRHNRTALGIKADGTVLLITVDGRFKGESAGMTLNELATTLRWLGCVNAINLDGGGSTTLYVKGWEENGVVNYPSDDGKFTHQGERPVSNTVIIK